MTEARTPNVLFYHSVFFRRSETFIYRQAINPHIRPLLLSKRFLGSTELPTGPFTTFQFGQPLLDRIRSKWFGSERYYGDRALGQLERLLRGASVDVIHAQFGGSGVRVLPLAQRMQVPLVVSFHGFDASQALAGEAYRRALPAVFDYASAIIICNPGMADALPLSEHDRAKVRWVPYGIDIGQFTSETTTAPHESFSILHVGRLVEKKGVPDLIRAFAQLAKAVERVTLRIVGEGSEEAECRAVVNEHGLQAKVEFLGWKSPGEVKALMQQCDLFVLNSRVDRTGDSEGLPVGLLEAMAMGRAVISTRHAGIPRAVEHDVSGVLVDERDTAAMAEQMLRLLRDPALRSALGAAARATVEQRFTMERMHETLRDIYRDVMR